MDYIVGDLKCQWATFCKATTVMSTFLSSFLSWRLWAASVSQRNVDRLKIPFHLHNYLYNFWRVISVSEKIATMSFPVDCVTLNLLVAAMPLLCYCMESSSDWGLYSWIKVSSPAKILIKKWWLEMIFSQEVQQCTRTFHPHLFWWRRDHSPDPCCTDLCHAKVMMKLSKNVLKYFNHFCGLLLLYSIVFQYILFDLFNKF